ncbi:hypothetical protein [Agrobacterium vaccinii]|uniref:hypothetical protein n=1 Tax=Agrobacterium vaccinii TaxID=2735528 RepID=UPI001E426428|nr:hypothetical protein [Agrobacterium vaccinii]UHS55503.1 hypothetical protein HRS00_01035 [Agrobacterium vaccinii]
MVGHLNGWVEEVRGILGAMGTMATLPSSSPTDALDALHVIADRWGASNYIAKKIAYVVAKDGRGGDYSKPLARLAQTLDQRNYSAPFFTSMEDMDPEFQYFASMSNRIKVLSKYVSDDYRQLLPLHNMVPVPVSKGDLALYLRKSHSMSLVDEVVALVIIYNMRDEWPDIFDVVNKNLDKDIEESLQVFLDVKFDSSAIYSDASKEYSDMTYYRRSAAFVEFQEPSKYRLFVDKIVSKRILGRYLPEDIDLREYNIPTVRDLTRSRIGFRSPQDYKDPQKCGTFLRTIWFLLYLENHRSTHRISHLDLRKIFDNTLALDLLLKEEEIERLYATADDDSRPLITVLALALYKSRSNDEDVDFKFRSSLSQTIIDQFDGSLVSFIEWLLPTSPEVANFLLSVLDRQTLQKMYWLVTSPRQADQVRQDILRTVGKARGIIEYFVEADAIEAQRQVSKLQAYFDDSRMYVDGYAMKRWLLENPSSYTQQYIRLIEHTSEAAGGLKVNLVSSATGGPVDAGALSAFDYILVEVAKSAFAQFCENTNFGIESYLGRRIRHNTLTGMMRGGVETLIEKPYYHVLSFDDAFMQAHAKWVADYRALIEYLRRDVLQFRSPQKPRGIFFSELNTEDESTKLNIAALRSTAFAAKTSDVFNELLIRFCWQEIDPQLDTAAKLVTVEMLNNAIVKLNEHFGNFDQDLQRQLRAELQNEVHARFTRLGSWFRQPDSGFVSASSKELGNLIFMEANDGAVLPDRQLQWHGDGHETMLDGLSVHRMYDCLSVLIRNAHKYGVEDEPIEVRVTSIPSPQTNIAVLDVVVSSKLKDDDQREEHIRRLRDCFNEDDLSAAMVKEGYSGIKKLRYITYNSEGISTVSYEVSNDTCTLQYILTVEVAESSAGEE